MATIVMKFGGTSVGDAERIRKSAALVADYADDHRIVVVVSALAKITDQILECARAAARGDVEKLQAGLAGLEQRHSRVMADLFPGKSAFAASDQVMAVLGQLREFCDALVRLRSLTPQLLDVALPMGEKMSAHIFAAVLREFGLEGEFVDASQVVVTNDHFGDAIAEMDATTSGVQRKLVPILDRRSIPVVTGFCGATSNGQPTTLGRGGSDTTGTILGTALRVDEVWIWTDVDGILTADPRVCANARVLPEITFAEAIELSYYGAKVIHRQAVRHAMEGRVPVRIKNSFRPDLPGTKITATCLAGEGPVKAVSAIPNTALVTLCAQNESSVAAAVLGHLFQRLGDAHIDVLFAMQSSAENSLGFVLRDEHADRFVTTVEGAFRSELTPDILESLHLERHLATIAVMGENVRGVPDILARLFSAVSRHGVTVTASALGASERSICLTVPSRSAADVVRAIHDEFLLEAPSQLEDLDGATSNEITAGL